MRLAAKQNRLQYFVKLLWKVITYLGELSILEINDIMFMELSTLILAWDRPPFMFAIWQS